MSADMKTTWAHQMFIFYLERIYFRKLFLCMKNLDNFSRVWEGIESWKTSVPRSRNSLFSSYIWALSPVFFHFIRLVSSANLHVWRLKSKWFWRPYSTSCWVSKSALLLMTLLSVFTSRLGWLRNSCLVLSAGTQLCKIRGFLRL